MRLLVVCILTLAAFGCDNSPSPLAPEVFGYWKIDSALTHDSRLNSDVNEYFYIANSDDKNNARHVYIREFASDYPEYGNTKEVYFFDEIYMHENHVYSSDGEITISLYIPGSIGLYFQVKNIQFNTMTSWVSSSFELCENKVCAYEDGPLEGTYFFQKIDEAEFYNLLR